jgi:hypothetical protein
VFRAGENAAHIFGPTLPEDQVISLVHRDYFFGIEIVAFMAGYAEGKNTIEGDPFMSPYVDGPEMTPAQQRLDGAVRVGEKATTLNRKLPRDRLKTEAYRLYSNEDERAAFFLGYCQTEYTVDQLNSEQRETASINDRKLAASLFGQDAEWRATLSVASFFKNNSAYEKGENFFHRYRRLSPTIVLEKANNAYSSLKEKRGYFQGYHDAAEKAGYSPCRGYVSEQRLHREREQKEREAAARERLNPKLRAALSPGQFAMLVPLMARNTQWGDKWDDHHLARRIGMWAKRVEEWMRVHPDATDEQISASAERFANFVGDPKQYRWRNIFKNAALANELLLRTDLRTT